MRLWSLHPRYLDARGLVALWRETLLAQKVLQGRTRGYRFHPQLNRFKSQANPLQSIAVYLRGIYQEALSRGYHFDKKKIGVGRTNIKIKVSRTEIREEIKTLLFKLKKRDYAKYRQAAGQKKIKLHPAFIIKRTAAHEEKKGWGKIK